MTTNGPQMNTTKSIVASLTKTKKKATGYYLKSVTNALERAKTGNVNCDKCGEFIDNELLIGQTMCESCGHYNLANDLVQGDPRTKAQIKAARDRAKAAGEIY